MESYVVPTETETAVMAEVNPEACGLAFGGDECPCVNPDPITEEETVLEVGTAKDSAVSLQPAVGDYAVLLTSAGVPIFTKLVKLTPSKVQGISSKRKSRVHGRVNDLVPITVYVNSRALEELDSYLVGQE